MAYFTGTANNPADLLLKLKSHAESLGWITDSSSTDEWCCHNTDGYWSIKAFNNRLELCGNTGFNSSAIWRKQPGTTAANGGSYYDYGVYYALNTTPFIAYHLFAAENYLHLVVEVDSGSFRPLLIGSLDKRGAVYEGGQYVCGLYWYFYNLTNNWNYYPFDGYAANYYFPYSSRVRVDG